MATRNLRDGQLTIKDGAAASLVVALDVGDLSFTQLQEAFVVLDRGVLDHFRDGDETAVEVSFTIKFQEWSADVSSGGTPSVVDALTQQGNASTWTSTQTNTETYTVDLEFLINNPAPSGTSETLTFSDFHATTPAEFNEGEEFNTLRVTGMALITKPTSAWA